ncbi:FHA domain-containing protein [bacterium]|nr:FHA domain-containing protein [bacterium]
MSDASLLIDGPGIWAYHKQLAKGARTTIGRTPNNDVVLPDTQVSSTHAIVFDVEGRWAIEDQRSRNGTFVNNKRIGNEELQTGDHIQIGRTEIVFRCKAFETAQADIWGQTVMRIHRHEEAVRGAIAQAEEDDVIVIPELSLSDRESIVEDDEDENDSFMPSDELLGDTKQVRKPHEPVVPPPPKESHEDSLWVAEKMASILGELATQRGKGRSELYRMVISRLMEAIDAENGFLMIPDKRDRRWVIRAWMGNEEEWTVYEKKHPVPLTVANQAFKEDRLVSNAYRYATDEDKSSESMHLLKVHCYIAMPLHRKGKRGGLLYFDTRKSLREFLPMHVKLIEKVGNYILEIERSVG